MRFNSYPDREFLYLRLADQIASELSEALRREGRATLSVPGGTTPGPVFDILSGVDLDWGLVSVVLNDERWVDESSERSNTRLVRARLLQARAARARLVPLYRADAPRPEEAIEALCAGLAPHLPITVLLVGMGADGHTASLFPKSEGLEAALAPDAPSLAIIRAEAAVEPRVTLTAPVLRGALHAHVLITGLEKRATIERAGSFPLSEAPIRTVLDQAQIHWAE